MDATLADHTRPDDLRYDALRRRDASQDGAFVYAVHTTGVYCRPSCPARLALRRNVSFHLTCAAAEQAGFRPCKRCRPNEASQHARHAALVAQTCRMIDAAETPPTLGALAAAARLSPHHFHRLFRQVTGITPKAYADARRAACLQENLAAAGSITHAIYDTGFNAPSRFYAAVPARLGMTPTAYRRGGADTAIRFAVGQCSLGAILVAATAIGICAIALGDDAETLVRDLQDRFPNASLAGGEPDFEATVARVVGFVDVPEPDLALPLDIRGTAFQQRVWEALRAIPPGRTATYTDIAGIIGAPKAVRAVAAACAANALAVAIPCHRVIRADGSLSGYRWGVERKQALLLRERAGA